MSRHQLNIYIGIGLPKHHRSTTNSDTHEFSGNDASCLHTIRCNLALIDNICPVRLLMQAEHFTTAFCFTIKAFQLMIHVLAFIVKQLQDHSNNFVTALNMCQ